MSNPFEEMIKKFADAVPEPLRNAQQDMESNMRGILESGLQKMNLVTREEFEIQSAVLQRTREKLEALEKRVAAMETDLLPPPAPNSSQQPEADQR